MGEREQSFFSLLCFFFALLLHGHGGRCGSNGEYGREQFILRRRPIGSTSLKTLREKKNISFSKATSSFLARLSELPFSFIALRGAAGAALTVPSLFVQVNPIETKATTDDRVRAKGKMLLMIIKSSQLHLYIHYVYF